MQKEIGLLYNAYFVVFYDLSENVSYSLKKICKTWQQRPAQCIKHDKKDGQNKLGSENYHKVLRTMLNTYNG